MIRNNVLLIRCSDGRSRKPEDVLDYCAHQIRMPGGILFPRFLSLSEDGGEKRTNTRLALEAAIETMIQLKNPTKVMLISHNHCGAAEALGLDDDSIHTIYAIWKSRLENRFPQIPVEVLHETHSECGSEHWGHTEVLMEA